MKSKFLIGCILIIFKPHKIPKPLFLLIYNIFNCNIPRSLHIPLPKAILKPVYQIIDITQIRGSTTLHSTKCEGSIRSSTYWYVFPIIPSFFKRLKTACFTTLPLEQPPNPNSLEQKNLLYATNQYSKNIHEAVLNDSTKVTALIIGSFQIIHHLVFKLANSIYLIIY